MAERNKPIDLEYLKFLKDDSLLNAKDIMQIFGFKHVAAFNKLVTRNQFPEHDIKRKGIKKMKMPVRYWYKKTVMDAIAKFNESLAKIEA